MGKRKGAIIWRTANHRVKRTKYLDVWSKVTYTGYFRLLNVQRYPVVIWYLKTDLKTVCHSVK